MPRLSLAPDLLDGDREAAYLVSATEADGRAAEVGRILGIPERSVQHRAKADGWAGRLDSERTRLAAVAVGAAQLARKEALHPVVAGPVRIPPGQGDTRTIVDPAGERATAEIPVPYQARVNAANPLLERTKPSSGLASRWRETWQVRVRRRDAGPGRRRQRRRRRSALPPQENLQRQRHLLEQARLRGGRAR